MRKMVKLIGFFNIRDKSNFTSDSKSNLRIQIIFIKEKWTFIRDKNIKIDQIE